MHEFVLLTDIPVFSCYFNILGFMSS